MIFATSHQSTFAASSPANHSFSQQILNTYYMADTVLGIWDASVTKQKEKDLCFCGTYIILSFFEGVEVGGKEQRQQNNYRKCYNVSSAIRKKTEQSKKDQSFCHWIVKQQSE